MLHNFYLGEDVIRFLEETLFFTLDAKRDERADNDVTPISVSSEPISSLKTHSAKLAFHLKCAWMRSPRRTRRTRTCKWLRFASRGVCWYTGLLIALRIWPRISLYGSDKLTNSSFQPSLVDESSTGSSQRLKTFMYTSGIFAKFSELVSLSVERSSLVAMGPSFN